VAADLPAAQRDPAVSNTTVIVVNGEKARLHGNGFDERIDRLGAERARDPTARLVWRPVRR
jgi:hypothetical protein